MGKVQCSVVGCHNGTYRLLKWKQAVCETHNVCHDSGDCCCPPPFKLIPFPTQLKNPERRREWIRIISRKNASDGKIWQPKSGDRICSVHFINGKYTEENPYPILNLVNVRTTSNTPKGRRILKRKINQQNIKSVKKRKLQISVVQSNINSSEENQNVENVPPDTLHERQLKDIV